jgi:hypothetical protein
MRSRRSLGPKDMYSSLTVDEGQGFAGVDGVVMFVCMLLLTTLHS